METILAVTNLHTYFYLKGGMLKAVSGVDLDIQREQIIGIVGESGSGKSTLGLSLLRLIRHPGRIVEGTIDFLGQDLLRKTEKEMEGIRGNKISVIFQDPVTYLNPSCRVGYQVSETLRLHRGLGRKEGLARSIQMLREMGIATPSVRAMDYPHQLSGGMCQRAMIAMALSCEPELIIADEPTTALDVTIQAQILELIKRIRDSKGTSILLITHDLGIVARMCDFVGIMYAGKIVEYGDVDTVFHHARHPYTIGLIHSIPQVSFEGGMAAPRLPGNRLQAIPGQPPDLGKLMENQCAYLPRCTQATEKCSREAPPVKEVGSNHSIRCVLQVEGK